MAKKVDLSQAQATVLERLLVDGSRSKYYIHMATVKALLKRGYVEEFSDWIIGKAIGIVPLGIDTLRQFPYENKHIEIVVEQTADHAKWLQRIVQHPERAKRYENYAKGALNTIEYEIDILFKINHRLAVVATNGQPPSEPTPEKSPKTPVKPKPVRKVSVSKCPDCVDGRVLTDCPRNSQHRDECGLCDGFGQYTARCQMCDGTGKGEHNIRASFEV